MGDSRPVMTSYKTLKGENFTKQCSMFSDDFLFNNMQNERKEERKSEYVRKTE